MNRLLRGAFLAAGLMIAGLAGAQDIDQKESYRVEAGATAGSVSVSGSNSSITVAEKGKAGSLAAKDGTISLAEGAEGGALRTMDGPIILAKGAKAESINTKGGLVRLDEGATAREIRSEKGDVTLEKNATVTGSINTDHADILLGPGARVGEAVRSVHGLVTIKGATVAGTVTVETGGLMVTDGAVIEGGIFRSAPKTKGKPDFMKTKKDKPKLPVVVIGPKAEVKGTLTFKEEVELFVHESAKVGAVTGATATPWSGDAPPKMPKKGDDGRLI